MNIPNIEFTWNNFFWTIFGGIIGLILSHYWTKYLDKNRLFVSFFCRQDYQTKCFFLYVSIHNEGNKPLPKLSIKLKGIYPDLKNHYFTELSDIDEIKPSQYQTFGLQITDKNKQILEHWEKLINKETYDFGLYIKIEKENSGIPLLYSNTYAVRALAQVLYYYENKFIDPIDGWEWLKEKEKKSYIKKIESRFPLKANFIVKLLWWDKFPDHYKMNYYKAKRKRL